MRRSKPCKEWREALRDLADGHVSQGTRAALEAHAESCEACAGELRAALRIRGLLDGTSEGELDGRLDEADWEAAPLNDQLKTTVPVEGGEPTGRTTIRVLAGPKALIIGIECFDDDPAGIVSFSKLRDADLENEDHIRIVIDPFLDGQSGYIFAVNANGARYDALVSRRGESENDGSHPASLSTY